MAEKFAPGVFTLSLALKQVGFFVKSVEEASELTDACIHITDKVHLQVGADYVMAVHVDRDGIFHYSEEATSFADLTRKLVDAMAATVEEAKNKLPDGAGLHVVITGSFGDGHRTYGPFKTGADAIQWADEQDLTMWEILPLLEP